MADHEFSDKDLCGDAGILNIVILNFVSESDPDEEMLK